MKDLSGKRALVTGGGSGVGAVIAQALAANGAIVWIAGRRVAPLEEIASLSRNIHTIVGDVTDPQDCVDMIRVAEGPDIVIANAGASLSKPFHRMVPEDLQMMISVNLFGVFNVFSAALEPMKSKGAGRLMSVASTAGLKGYPYVSAYVAAKHAVIGLTRALALELARTDITVNALCPGFTETPMLRASVDNIVTKTGRSVGEAEKALIATNPQGRFVQPQEVADAVLWLAGPGAGAITGQSISISGGEVM